MAKRKNPEEQPTEGTLNPQEAESHSAPPTNPSGEIPVAEPVSDTNGTVPEVPPNGKNRPVASFKCYSDRTTKIEAAVWPYEVTYGDGTKNVRYGVVLSRSYKDSK